MVLISRYFPVVVLLGFLLLLVIPLFYMDQWVFLTNFTRPPPASSGTTKKASEQSPKHLNINFHRSEQNEISQSGDEPDRDTALQSAKKFRMLNRMRIQQQNRMLGMRMGPGGMPLGMGGGALAPNLPFHMQRISPRASEFALQMARDRLRIERYSMMMQNSDGNASGPEWDDWVKASSSTDNSTQKLQVLIVSYFRGGTTFFGDLLNQYPGTFYHFEPFHGISGNDQVREEKDIFSSIRLLRHLLRCEYEDSHEYIDWIRKDMTHRFLFEHNKRLWLSCQFQLPLCFDPKFLRSICELHPIHVFKIVRLRLSHARRLLDEFPKLKLIYLARDPRGLYSSRRDLEWCSTTRSCIDPDFYCPDMLKDLSTAIALKIKYPDRFLAMRYEDLALDTENQLKKVLQFLELSYNRTHKQMDRFIESHTKSRFRGTVDDGGPYSIRRDSRKTAFSWRKKLSPHEVSYVETACKDVIKQLALP